jgi:hypothetical protein
MRRTAYNLCVLAVDKKKLRMKLTKAECVYTVQYCTVYSTVQLLYSTVLYSTVQYTVLYCTVYCKSFAIFCNLLQSFVILGFRV